MALYRMKGGVQQKISRREFKQTIMRANNWNETQYRKQYDLFKNKLRFYENIQKSRGVSVDVQSPQELLYKIAKAKLRYGSEYEPSQEVRQIMAVTAHSITKGKKIATSGRGRSYAAAVGKIVNIRFSGFVDYYDKAKDIVYGVPLTINSDPADIERLTEGKEYETRADQFGNEQIYVDDTPLWIVKPITDPVKQEEALTALANWLHSNSPRAGKDKGGGSIAYGETYGSSDTDAGADFDYSYWLDE